MPVLFINECCTIQYDDDRDCHSNNDDDEGDHLKDDGNKDEHKKSYDESNKKCQQRRYRLYWKGRHTSKTAILAILKITANVNHSNDDSIKKIDNDVLQDCALRNN